MAAAEEDGDDDEDDVDDEDVDGVGLRARRGESAIVVVTMMVSVLRLRRSRGSSSGGESWVVEEDSRESDESGLDITRSRAFDESRLPALLCGCNRRPRGVGGVAVMGSASW